MAGKSLLEIETARRRLEQLDAEQQELSSLIQKLKHIRDSMSALAASTEANKQETEQWLTSLKKEAVAANQQTRGAIEGFSNALRSFEKKANELLDRTSELPDQILAQFADLERELRKVIDAERNDLNARFDAFHDEHFKSLDEVSKTYERMRISYDTVRDGIHSLEDVSDNLRREHHRYVQDNDKRFGEIEKLINEQDRFSESVTGRLDLLHATMDSTAAEVAKVVGNTERRLTELRKSLSELAVTVRGDSESYQRGLRVLRLGIILALLLGGLALLWLFLR